MNVSALAIIGFEICNRLNTDTVIATLDQVIADINTKMFFITVIEAFSPYLFATRIK